MSEALKSNTTLTELNLTCENARHTKDDHQQFTFLLRFISTDNDIGETGATSLSESLKSNTTLTKLYLCGEDKRRKKTHKNINQQFTLFISLLINREQD